MSRHMDQSSALAASIRAELGRQSKSRAELAREMGVTEMWLSRRLTGRQTPITVDDLARIADGLGVTVNDLMAEASA